MFAINLTCSLFHCVHLWATQGPGGWRASLRDQARLDTDRDLLGSSLENRRFYRKNCKDEQLAMKVSPKHGRTFKETKWKAEGFLIFRQQTWRSLSEFLIQFFVFWGSDSGCAGSLTTSDSACSIVFAGNKAFMKRMGCIEMQECPRRLMHWFVDLIPRPHHRRPLAVLWPAHSHANHNCPSNNLCLMYKYLVVPLEQLQKHGNRKRGWGKKMKNSCWKLDEHAFLDLFRALARASSKKLWTMLCNGPRLLGVHSCEAKHNVWIL